MSPRKRKKSDLLSSFSPNCCAVQCSINSAFTAFPVISRSHSLGAQARITGSHACCWAIATCSLERPIAPPASAVTTVIAPPAPPPPSFSGEAIWDDNASKPRHRRRRAIGVANHAYRATNFTIKIHCSLPLALTCLWSAWPSSCFDCSTSVDNWVGTASRRSKTDNRPSPSASRIVNATASLAPQIAGASRPNNVKAPTNSSMESAPSPSRQPTSRQRNACSSDPQRHFKANRNASTPCGSSCCSRRCNNCNLSWIALLPTAAGA
mmetsp:Transcript_50863/g.80642  ORF Transcript_50863/g.80642 Transcript_50863/m.80642 type:complete len:266 (-) Transcript_50863:798-1595(-)